MMRRYSRPRVLSAGCTSPRRPRATNSSGLTTIPSPPAAVSSSHQTAPARSLSGRSFRRPDGSFVQEVVGAAKVGQGLRVPDVVLVDVNGALAREEVERRELELVDRA